MRLSNFLSLNKGSGRPDIRCPSRPHEKSGSPGTLPPPARLEMRRLSDFRRRRTLPGRNASLSTAPGDTLPVGRGRVDRPLPTSLPRADKSPSPMTLDDPVEPENESHTGSTIQQPVSSTSGTRHIPLRVPSPKANAALISFKTSLLLLAKAPLPGIGVVAGALVEIISHHQDLTQIGEALQRLTNCMEHLWFLVNRVIECDERNEDLCKPLVEELNKLQDDLEISSREGRLIAFFNSTEKLRSVKDHISDLDRIIMSLTFFISARTNKTTIELQEEFQKAISSIRTSIQDKDESSSGDMVINMSKNEIDGVGGSIASGNVVYGNRAVKHEFLENKIGHVGGAILSNNIAVNAISPAAADDLFRSLGLNSNFDNL